MPTEDFFLNERFLEEYCLRLTRGATETVDSVGVAFRPSRPQSGIVQLVGVFWLSRNGQMLSRLTFEYDGLPPEEASGRAGGVVEFTPIRGDTWAMTRWEVRMPQVDETLVARRRDSRDQATTSVVRRLSGIHVYSATIKEILMNERSVYSAPRADSIPDATKN
jgi:hypothetical protein